MGTKAYKYQSKCELSLNNCQQTTYLKVLYNVKYKS